MTKIISSKSPIFLVSIFLASILVGNDALSFSSQRAASVEIVDSEASITPVFSAYGNNYAYKTSQNVAGPVFFSKTMQVPASGAKSDGTKFIEEAIEAEYVISGSNNNVQLSLYETGARSANIQFKSVKASSTKTNAKSNESSVKLATVVQIPNNINSGKYSLSLQLSAIYE